MIRTILGVLGVLLSTSMASGQVLPNINTQGLGAEEVGVLETLMREGACPCDTRISIFECLKAQSCPAAKSLADYGVAKFRAGLGPEEVSEALVKKYMNDHIRYEFDLSVTPRKGAAKPLVEVVEFADFECPHCAEMRTTLEELVKSYPKEVAVYFKQFPLSHHTYSHIAARAALAAGRQGRFWQMHDLLFINQGQLNDQSMVKFARELGLNTEKFEKDLADSHLFAQVDKDRQEAIQANIAATPTLYINGRMYVDGKTPNEIKAFVADLVTELRSQNKKPSSPPAAKRNQPAAPPHSGKK